MADLARTDDIFFNRADLDLDQTERLVAESLNGADDGELFLEYRQSESLAFDDGRLKTAAFDTSQGFGLRAIAGEARGFAFASDLSLNAIRRAAKTVTAVTDGHSGSLAAAPAATNRALYIEDNPLEVVDFAAKVKILQDI
ncbi:MAG: DNA gyrase modulator, partial [Pseudomonadota bacterium]|nr:DNA gyrase modulator [Pseudomonadota bacterium]